MNKKIKLKPKKKILKIYPELCIYPSGNYKFSDRLDLTFKDYHIEIVAYIEGAGNTFKIPYTAISELLIKERVKNGKTRANYKI